MTISAGVWRLHLKWWLPPLIFLAANVLLLSAYRLVYAGQAQLRSSRVERNQTELTRLRTETKRLEQELERVESSRAAIDTFYGERLAREDERLTRILAEVRGLASRAGLEPKSFDYRKEEFEEHDLLRRSIEFNVEGSYLAFRRFVNLLELSDSFLVLEQVALRGADDTGNSLRISLVLSTLFTSSGVEARSAAATGEASG